MCARYDDEWIAAMMDTKGRFGSQTPEELLADTGLGAGQAVVDLGCGPGLLALVAARMVGREGKVFAVDTEGSMLDQMYSRAKHAGLENIETVHSDGGRTPLADGSADYAICSLVLHFPPDFPRRVEMAKDVARLLRSGGRSLWIEWTPKEDNDSATRLGPEEAAEILGEAGFECDAARPVGDMQFSILAALASTE